jgi:hypothetical protein
MDTRTSRISELGDAFNETHDRALDTFLMPFVEAANGVMNAPPNQIRPAFRTTTSLIQPRRPTIASGSPPTESLMCSRAARRVPQLGLPSAGQWRIGPSWQQCPSEPRLRAAAIWGLSGAAATNAALALLGGGTLAAGGAGVAGGAALLAGIVAAPALVLAVGGLVCMVKRNRKQQQELSEKLNHAEAEIAATQRGYEPLIDILPRATQILDYIAVHASHALKKWEGNLGPRPLDWGSMSHREQRRYQDFVEISARKLSVVSINVQSLMTSRGDERERLIEFGDEVLCQAQATVESLV